MAKPIPAFTAKEKLQSLPGALPILVLFLIVIGGIFAGWFTANEAAAVGAVISLVYLIAVGRFSWKVLIDCLRDTVKTSGMIFLILIGAYVFGAFLSITRLSTILAEFVGGLTVSRYVILAVIILIYAVMGCLMDSLAMVMLTVPIFFPIMTAQGFNGIWYGVLMIMVMEMGLITPPVGMNVYIVAGVARTCRSRKYSGALRRWCWACASPSSSCASSRT